MYTRKGDNGLTGTFACDQKISKSSIVAEALGTLDELNSLLGVCKTKVQNFDIEIYGKSLGEIISEVQNNLFTAQAEVGDAEKYISEEKVGEIEAIIDEIEAQLPEIKSFSVPGGSEPSAMFDFARAVSRRAERRIVQLHLSSQALIDQGQLEKKKISSSTLAYLNRLSSLLFALARFVNHKYGIQEENPIYD